METLVRDFAKNRTILATHCFGLSIVPTQIYDADVLSWQVFQRFGEQGPGRDVCGRERISDESHFMGFRQSGERARPDKPKYGLFDETRLRENRWNHDGFMLKVAAYLRVSEPDA